jgi:TPP-dependent pyruvate/acetoin dehydrogenase alpha subunit
VARARAGQGPTFVEFLTYRYEGHHTFEIRTRPRYRDPEEIARWKARDPLALQARRIPDDLRGQIDAEAESTVEAAVRFALSGPKPDPADARQYLYASGLQTRPGVAARAEERTVRQ